MKNLISTAAIIIFAALLSCGTNSSNKETHLQIEVVDIPDEEIMEQDTGSNNSDVPENNTGGGAASLFGNEPGTWVKLSSVGGIIDPVGTTLAEDFDGDAIDNDDETASNAWVADYPLIETSISPPITMKIEILQTETNDTIALSSEITSDDVESTKDNSMEEEHRDELNTRTVQYQDAYNESVSDSSETATSVSASTSSSGEENSSSSTSYRALPGAAGTGAGPTSESSSSSSGNSESSSTSEESKVAESHTNAYSETTTKWDDIPFKNNLESDGWAQKSNEAAKKARQIRSDVREESKLGYEIKPNAGYIRAALYITNETVNMPVKIRDILCSFMFQSGDGQLIPVQSFRLRNDDYTIFEIELYGDSTFGPYVIELKNLNTEEVKEAIAKGYNPKIFIIDYKMRHVDDSNYRDLLADNFTGDNLKIIEENAKGRTAGVKFVGPGIREFYRVVAFDSDGTENRTGSNGVINVSPGVSLEKALRRISFSGTDIQLANYVIDMSGSKPEMTIPRFLVRGIKSIGGVETRIPLVLDGNGNPVETVTGPTVDENGNPLGTGGNITAYVMKPVNEWTDDDKNSIRMWAVFSDARYYFHAADKYIMLGDTKIDEYFEYTLNGELYRIPKVMGIESVIWPGDHYDIVCLELKEYNDHRALFGKNPFETKEVMSVNTRWNLDELGDEYSYFYPDKKSIYLGEACPGDIIEFNITLKNTKYLNPDFGTPTVQGSYNEYTDFDYNFSTQNFKYDLEEAIDFEINFGLGGDYTSWINLVEGRSEFFYYINEDDTPVYAIAEVDRNWNFLNQEFSIWLEIPPDLKGVTAAEGVKVFLRPALNSAFRESFWPVPYAKVKKFTGMLYSTVNSGNSITIENGIGTIDAGETISVITKEEILDYTVNLIDDQGSGKYKITFNEIIVNTLSKGDAVFIELGTPLSGPEVALSVHHNFVTEWNTVLPSDWYNDDNYDEFAPLMDGNPLVAYNPMTDLGFTPGAAVANWLGNSNFNIPMWNNWADASYFNGLFSGLPVISMPGMTAGVNMSITEVVTGMPHGLNNFFIAPLIERNYEVQVRIVE